MFVRTLLATVATILLAHPTSAQAHRQSEFALVLGGYLPTNQLGLGQGWVSADYCSAHAGEPECPNTKRRSENRGMAVGARWTGWLGRGAGIESSFWLTVGGSTGMTALSSLRGVFRFDPHAKASVVLLAGPAMINRFDYSDDLASFGGVVGIGLEMRSGHGFGLRAQIEDNLYSVQRNYGDGFFQHDWVLSLSVSPFGR